MQNDTLSNAAGQQALLDQIEAARDFQWRLLRTGAWMLFVGLFLWFGGRYIREASELNFLVEVALMVPGVLLSGLGGARLIDVYDQGKGILTLKSRLMSEPRDG